jgi:hypothetical protein
MSQDLRTYTGHIQWMLYISSPDRLSHLIFGIATLSHTEISDFQEALLTCIIWNREFNRHRNRKYFETTPVAPQTKSRTVWLSSMNIQYSPVSECMGFHLSKGLFSISNCSWPPGNWIFAIFHCLYEGEWFILAHYTTYRTLNCIDKVAPFINNLRWLKFCQEKSTYILPMYHGFLEKKQLFSSQQCIKNWEIFKNMLCPF